ncbi:MAG: hypothetical protein ACIAQF_08135 [Phycisphaerales bacterium JB065]
MSTRKSPRHEPHRLDYGSHVSLLAWAAANSGGTIVEFGAGFWSTPILRRIAGNRQVISYERDPDWAEAVGGCELCVRPWEMDIPEDTGLVFIDCDSPDNRHEGRAEIAERLKATGYMGLVVAHDVKPKFSRYYTALQAFNSRWEDEKIWPPTGIYTDQEVDFAAIPGFAGF